MERVLPWCLERGDSESHEGRPALRPGDGAHIWGPQYGSPPCSLREGHRSMQDGRAPGSAAFVPCNTRETLSAVAESGKM